MQTLLPPPPAALIELRGVNLDLPEAARVSAQERASRLIAAFRGIAALHAEVERVKTVDTEGPFVAKGQVEVDGSALLASVTSDDPSRALEFLLAKFEQLLRRRRARA